MPKLSVKRAAVVVAGVLATAAAVGAPAANADSSPGHHLVAFSKVPSETKSVKIDGRCLRSLPSGKSYKSGLTVQNDSTPELTFYSSSNCGSGAQSDGFIDVNHDNLKYVWVSWRTYHPYWGHPNLAS